MTAHNFHLKGYLGVVISSVRVSNKSRYIICTHYSIKSIQYSKLFSRYLYLNYYDFLKNQIQLSVFLLSEKVFPLLQGWDSLLTLESHLFHTGHLCFHYEKSGPIKSFTAPIIQNIAPSEHNNDIYYITITYPQKAVKLDICF